MNSLEENLHLPAHAFFTANACEKLPGHRTNALAAHQQGLLNNVLYLVMDANNVIGDILEFGDQKQIQRVYDAYNCLLLEMLPDRAIPTIVVNHLSDYARDNMEVSLILEHYPGALVKQLIDPRLSNSLINKPFKTIKEYLILYQAYQSLNSTMDAAEEAFFDAITNVAPAPEITLPLDDDTLPPVEDKPMTYVEACRLRKQAIADAWQECKNAIAERKRIDEEQKQHCADLRAKWNALKTSPAPQRTDFEEYSKK